MLLRQNFCCKDDAAVFRSFYFSLLVIKCPNIFKLKVKRNKRVVFVHQKHQNYSYLKHKMIELGWVGSDTKCTETVAKVTQDDILSERRTEKDRQARQTETETGRDSGHSSKPDYKRMWIWFPNRWSRSETVRCISQQWWGERGRERHDGRGKRGGETDINSSLWQYWSVQLKRWI